MLCQSSAGSDFSKLLTYKHSISAAVCQPAYWREDRKYDGELLHGCILGQASYWPEGMYFPVAQPLLLAKKACLQNNMTSFACVGKPRLTRVVFFTRIVVSKTRFTCLSCRMGHIRRTSLRPCKRTPDNLSCHPTWYLPMQFVSVQMTTQILLTYR